MNLELHAENAVPFDDICEVGHHIHDFNATLRTHRVCATQWNAHGDHELVGRIDQQVYDTFPSWTQERVVELQVDRGLTNDQIGVIGSGVNAYIVTAGEWIGIQQQTPLVVWVMSDAEFKRQYVLDTELSDQ